MNGLLNITTIRLPIEHINEVYAHLQKTGKEGLEGVALWAGTFEGTVFTIEKTIIPQQTSYNIEEGLSYSVDGDELFKINKWLYTNKKTLISQIHSHPSEAYHSDMDNRYPIVTVVGGVSIVVPYFAVQPFSLDNWAVYRLSLNGEWVFHTNKQVHELIQVIE